MEEKKTIAYDMKEAAAACGVSTGTMQMMVNREDFPAFRVGRRWVIPRDSLNEWLKRQAAKRQNFDTSKE